MSEPMTCQFCQSDREVQEYKTFNNSVHLCRVCSRLNGTEYGRVSNENIMYAIVQLFHALDLRPLDEGEDSTP